MGELLTLLVFIAGAWWVLRLIIEDIGYLRHGRPSPRLAARLARTERAGAGGGRRRYGARSYFGDLWEDAWKSANVRRRARAKARAAGRPRFPRLAAARARLGGWWRQAGGHREAHRIGGGQVGETWEPTAWDQAWTQVEQRRSRRRARREARRNRRRTGSAAPGGPNTPPRSPDGGRQPPAREGADQPRPRAAPPHGGQPEGNGHQPVAGDRMPHPRHAPRQPLRKDDNTMAEVTGLSSALTSARGGEQAATDNARNWEQHISGLSAGEVGSEAIATAHRAMEAEQAAAAAAAEHVAALERQLPVKEAYEANPEAGNKQFVTSE